MEHYSLYQLNRLIGDTLNRELELTYWVTAEIGELRLHQKGHCYLEMVEKDGNEIRAKMRATIWSYSYREISSAFSAATGEGLRPGLRILFNASVQFHEVYGLSLNIRHIDAGYTLGERARRRQAVIDQLRTEGIFDRNKSLILPIVPQRVAVISSPTAAGYGDFINQLDSNTYGYRFRMELFEASMQGDEAEVSILHAMQEVLHKKDSFDLLVIIRGGGAAIDLDCFDLYSLSAAAACFPIPVLTGIGHERDETVLDLVAHSRLKTPTAVAEFLISGMRAYEEAIDAYLSAIFLHTENALRNETHRLQIFTLRIRNRVSARHNQNETTLANLAIRTNAACRSRIKQADFELSEQSNRLKRRLPSALRQIEDRLDYLSQRLELLDPHEIIRRGYTVSLVEGLPLGRRAVLKPGDQLTTLSAVHSLKSTIDSVEPR